MGVYIFFVLVGLPLDGEKSSHWDTSSFLPASGKMRRYHRLMTIIAVIITSTITAIYFVLSLSLLPCPLCLSSCLCFSPGPSGFPMAICTQGDCRRIKCCLIPRIPIARVREMKGKKKKKRSPRVFDHETPGRSSPVHPGSQYSNDRGLCVVGLDLFYVEEGALR